MVPSILWIRAGERRISVRFGFLDAIERSVVSVQLCSGAHRRLVKGEKSVMVEVEGKSVPVSVGFLVLVVLRGVLGFCARGLLVLEGRW